MTCKVFYWSSCGLTLIILEDEFFGLLFIEVSDLFFHLSLLVLFTT